MTSATITTSIECTQAMTTEGLESAMEPHMIKVCELSDLAENSGVCALVGTVQIAIFTLSGDADNSMVYALSNWDPIGKANVMYRGILCSVADEPAICSPLYKQHYSLLTGACFEHDDKQLTVYPCTVHGNDVYVTRVAQKPVIA